MLSKFDMLQFTSFFVCGAQSRLITGLRVMLLLLLGLLLDGRGLPI